jgi:hypothetical protein
LLSVIPHAHENLVLQPNADRLMFAGICPTHGRRLVTLDTGHHNTIGRKTMRERYPKAQYDALHQRLGSEDAHRLKEAWHGRYEATEEDHRFWSGAS